MLAVAAVTGCSCGRGAPVPAGGIRTPGFLDVQVPPKPAASGATLARGRELFTYNCAHCHGEHGEGNGYGAPFLVPQPRNFVAAKYKFRTTASGELPTDADLFRTISRGATGTGMPPWQYLAERRRSLGARRLREGLFAELCRGPGAGSR